MATLRRVAALGVALALSAAGEVAAQAVAEVDVVPPTVSLQVGQKQGIVATAYDARSNVLPTVHITWSSTNVTVARVEPDARQAGVATIIAVAAGVASIEASVGTRKGTVQVQVAGGGAGGGGGGAAGGGVPVTAQPVTPVIASTAIALRIDPNSVFLLPSEDARLALSFLQADGSQAPPLAVTWRSLNEAVASVGPDGSVVGVSSGQGVVEARTVTGLVARAFVQVSNAPVSFGVDVFSLEPGQQDTVTLMVPSQGNRRVASKWVTWTSTNPGVVSVTPMGVATGVNPGRAEIFASGFGQTARLPVVVHKAVEQMAVTPPQGPVTIPVSGSAAFGATAYAADGSTISDAPFTWRIADTSVAWYDSASMIVRGRRIGRTQLRVQGPGRGLEASWTIEVVAGGLGLAPAHFGLFPGERRLISASFVNDRGESLGPATGVQWMALNSAIAAVDNSGSVQGVAYGHGRIVATTSWGKADTADVFVQGEVLVNSTRRGNVPKLFAFDRGAPGRFNQLSQDTTTTGSETEGAYSPDGSRVAYVSDRDGNAEIYVMWADGSSPRRLTNTTATEASPVWTPDGSHIIYSSNAVGATTGTFHIWTMSAEGADQHPLTSGQTSDFQPAVSPDGKTVAFTSDRDGNYNIYLMGVDGTNQRQFTKDPTPETNPVWFTDGQLAYLVQEPGKNSLTSRVLRANLATGETTPISPTGLAISEFDASKAGDMLALVVTTYQRSRNVSQRLYLLALTVGATPVEVPATGPQDRITSPSFRR